MEKQTSGPKVTFVDTPDAPEFFASEASGFFVNQGNVTITFASARVDHSTSPGPVNRVVNARVVLSVLGAQSFAIGLYDFLKTQGLDPSPKPPEGTPTH